jgi:hypothetical protein
MPISNGRSPLRRVLLHYLTMRSSMIALLFIGFASTGLAADVFYPDRPGAWALTTEWRWLPKDYWIPVTREQYLQALIRTTKVGIAKSKKQIADAGDPYNPEFFDPALPPTAWQIMTLKFSWALHEHSATMRHVGFARLHQFAYDTDWSRTAPLLD